MNVNNLTYSDLKKYAKKIGVNGKGKKNEIMRRITLHLNTKDNEINSKYVESEVDKFDMSQSNEKIDKHLSYPLDDDDVINTTFELSPLETTKYNLPDVTINDANCFDDVIVTPPQCNDIGKSNKRKLSDILEPQPKRNKHEEFSSIRENNKTVSINIAHSIKENCISKISNLSNFKFDNQISNIINSANTPDKVIFASDVIKKVLKNSLKSSSRKMKMLHEKAFSQMKSIEEDEAVKKDKANYYATLWNNNKMLTRNQAKISKQLSDEEVKPVSSNTKRHCVSNLPKDGQKLKFNFIAETGIPKEFSAFNSNIKANKPIKDKTKGRSKVSQKPLFNSENFVFSANPDQKRSYLAKYTFSPPNANRNANALPLFNKLPESALKKRLAYNPFKSMENVPVYKPYEGPLKPIIMSPVKLCSHEINQRAHLHRSAKNYGEKGKNLKCHTNNKGSALIGIVQPTLKGNI